MLKQTFLNNFDNKFVKKLSIFIDFKNNKYNLIFIIVNQTTKMIQCDPC